MKYWNRIEYKTPLIYLVLSMLYIVLSDSLLFNHITSSENTKLFSILKGILFVTSTTIIIYYLIKQDIIKIRSINENLTKSNDYYYSLFKNNHIASLLVNPENLIIEDANDAALNLYGYDLNTIREHKFSDLNYDISKQNNTLHNQILTSTEKQKNIRSIHKTYQNEMIDVEIFSGPIIINNKSNILVAINDITVKSRIEKSLKESEYKYKTLVENIPDVFYIFSVEKGLIYISPQIKSLTGYLPSKNDLFTDIIFKHILNEDKNKLLGFRKNIIDSHDNAEINYRINDSEGNIKWVQDRVFLVYSTDKDTILEGVISDITEKNILIEELIQAHSRINDSLKIKNVILSNLNHELRTPLNGILGFSKLIHKSTDNDVISEYSELVIESANRLSNTLNSLLTLNEIELGHRKLYFEETSVKDFLRLVYDSNASYVSRKNLDFLIDVKEDLELYTDISILSEIFFNLIDNAVKFTYSGTITLRGEFVTKGGMWIKLSVIDTGIGISTKNSISIFEPFRQESEGIDRNFEGIGIGLTICSKLISLLNGKIEVASKPDAGSTFMIYIPFSVPAEINN
jgi:PAS domain S-box-containing protein